MFDNLSDRLRGVTDRLRGRGRLTEENVSEAVRDVRRALLEADVALPVVRKHFVERVRVQSRAVGDRGHSKSLSPGQAFIKILHTELTETLGGTRRRWRGLRTAPSAPRGRAAAGRPAGRRQDHHGRQAGPVPQQPRRDRRRVMLASLDTRRPAAMLQLEQLAARVGAEFVSRLESGGGSRWRSRRMRRGRGASRPG